MHVVLAGRPVSDSGGARLLRPFGTAVRAIIGLALIVVPIASSGLAAWDALGALAVLPVLAVALDRLLAVAIPAIAMAAGRPLSGEARTWTAHVSALVLIVVVAIALTFVTPIDAGAIWLFLGVSMVIGAIRGDAGCEALTIPNAIFGRRERTGCVAFALIDSLEAR
jgi:hypothetical protein